MAEQDALPMNQIENSNATSLNNESAASVDQSSVKNKQNNDSDNESIKKTSADLNNNAPPPPEEMKEKGMMTRVRRAIMTKPHLFIIFIISVFGFCYHFNITLNQYWSYSTTVTFAHEDPQDYKFEYPSATVCFQDVVPYYELEKNYPEYRENVEKLREEMARRNDTTFWNKAETKKILNVTGVQSLEGLHIHKFFEEKIFKSEPIVNILEKYSHSQHEECLLDSMPTSKAGYKMNHCENITLPVESINGEYRCYTYFLKFDKPKEERKDENFLTSMFISSKTFERRTNKVYYMSHTLNQEALSHPFERDLRARIAIHPSNQIPVPEFYPTISLYQYSRFYVINFEKTVSHLLEAPYKTNCYKYDLGNTNATQSNDDCFTKCVMNRYREKCKCLPRSGLLYRKALLTADDKFCAVINKCQFTNYRAKCAQQCKPDCVEEKFEFEKFVDIPFYAHHNLTGVQISRKPALDKVYRHAPAMTFIQLVCDFGGLGGLWLGFSVISITTSIIQILAHPVEKIVTTEDERKRRKSSAKSSSTQ